MAAPNNRRKETIKPSNAKNEFGTQKLVIALSISSFAMLLVVVVLSWYVFDYSSKKDKINTNINSQNLAGESVVLPDDTQKQTTGDSIAAPENLNAEEVARMISKHMLLSEGNMTVASITNIEGLREDYPELFLYAKNGDKILFYQLGLIIYDPVLDKIVDVMRRLPEGTYIPSSPADES